MIAAVTNKPLTFTKAQTQCSNSSINVDDRFCDFKQNDV